MMPWAPSADLKQRHSCSLWLKQDHKKKELVISRRQISGTKHQNKMKTPFSDGGLVKHYRAPELSSSELHFPAGYAPLRFFKLKPKTQAGGCYAGPGLTDARPDGAVMTATYRNCKRTANLSVSRRQAPLKPPLSRQGPLLTGKLPPGCRAAGGNLSLRGLKRTLQTTVEQMRGNPWRICHDRLTDRVQACQ
jgi:hypothetical protein